MTSNVPSGRGARVGTLLVLAALLLSCREAPAQETIDAATSRSYVSGRSQEIEFTSVALGMLACAKTADQRRVILAGSSPEHAEVAAAAAVGMRVADYRALVHRVDSVLSISRNLDSRTRPLDSLRVELTVLRTRMSAGDASPFRNPPCNEPRPSSASPSI